MVAVTVVISFVADAAEAAVESRRGFPCLVRMPSRKNFLKHVFLDSGELGVKFCCVS